MGDSERPLSMHLYLGHDGLEALERLAGRLDSGRSGTVRRALLVLEALTEARAAGDKILLRSSAGVDREVLLW